MQKSKTLQIRINRELAKKFREFARSKGLLYSYAVEQALTDYMRQDTKGGVK